MLNGWKAIAGHLHRDERTAMRWATERGMPVHRVPGPGRGSVYALEGELDAWFEADRARFEPDRATPAATEPSAPPEPGTSKPRWWPRRWIASALIASGAMLVAVGAMTLRRDRMEIPAPAPVFTDPAANAAFLRASYDWNLRTPDSLTRAVREYGDAIARDPRVPAAYVGLANSYLLLREYGSLPDAEAYARAEAAAQAAIALAPSCAEAHRALAFIAFWWRQDRAAARREFREALRLRPDDALTHHWFATALVANGESVAALREINQARQLDPASTAIVADQGLILYAAGYRAEALQTLQNLVLTQPDAIGPHHYLREIALAEGRTTDFLREAAATARLRSDNADLRQVRRWQAARNVELTMLRDAEQAGADWLEVARMSAMTGDRKQAMTALARACSAREPNTVSAPGDLLLRHALSPSDITAQCPNTPTLS